MQINLSGSSPVYMQLFDAIRLDIALGKLLPGDRLRSSRELAAAAGVNPNAMEKALIRLEAVGLARLEGAALIITGGDDLAGTVRRELAESRIDEFLAGMAELGISPEAAAELIAERMRPNADT